MRFSRTPLLHAQNKSIISNTLLILVLFSSLLSNNPRVTGAAARRVKPAFDVAPPLRKSAAAGVRRATMTATAPPSVSGLGSSEFLDGRYGQLYEPAHFSHTCTLDPLSSNFPSIHTGAISRSTPDCSKPQKHRIPPIPTIIIPSPFHAVIPRKGHGQAPEKQSY